MRSAPETSTTRIDRNLSVRVHDQPHQHVARATCTIDALAAADTHAGASAAAGARLA
jgi:hypothetical protein